MTDRPILFSAPMVIALLEGRKTQTRRIVKPQPRAGLYMQPMHGRSPPPDPIDFGNWRQWRQVGPDYPDADSDDIWCPYGERGDRLWVKETWRPLGKAQGRIPVLFAASRGTPANSGDRFDVPRDWKRPKAAKTGYVSPLFMPRWASRITLEITGVRVERLREISEKDAKAEGVERSEGLWRDYLRGPTSLQTNARGSYWSLWESINGAGSWAANPWVWAITFKRVTP